MENERGGLVYRKSKEKDSDVIDELIKRCFGSRSEYGALANLNDRYLLAFENDKLIAMTGIWECSPEFYGAEIDWTCVLPEYRGRGIVTNMLRQCIENCDNDIYCSCLRLNNNDKISLHYAMKTLGFTCVANGRKKYGAKWSKACDVCIYKTSEQCTCQEDLYVKLR